MNETWEEEWEKRFGGGDESGDFPSNAAKAFIRQTLRAQLEELIQAGEDIDTCFNDGETCRSCSAITAYQDILKAKLTQV